MGHAGFRSATVQLAAGGFGHTCQAAHDAHAHRVAQRIQQALKGEVFRFGVLEGSHGVHDIRASVHCHSSITIEQLKTKVIWPTGAFQCLHCSNPSN
ncbi:3-oxoacyl-(acyl-carrier-protein) synthase [Pseudomonas syringae pv. actinidiae]|uniref:3-oxoacyl-(Acyl-carrier-protein) synthase n=1 Tax=Pseudomonas syringae pv. actinidiae TaxID=103796 RepID=A0AAN4TMQ5_PSESF|nr:3-oxoacyl-(acyl-carrier-protein) synthase [Pseudomonas syringae pv. actinidiae]